MSIFTAPLATTSNSARADARSSSRARDIVEEATGRVRNSDARASADGSTGGTAPDDWPNNTSMPRMARQASDASNVRLPTPSNTTLTPAPPVSSFTRATTSSLS